MAASGVSRWQELRPAEDRVERRAQLVRERGEELVLHAAHSLGLGAGGAFGREELLSFFDELLIFGNVAGDFRGADDVAGSVVDGRDRDRDVDAAAVFADADGFEMIDAFAPADFRQNGGFFVESLGRQQNQNRLADDFVGGVAEDALGGRVPTEDDAVEIFADDRVVGSGNDGGQPRLQFVGLHDGRRRIVADREGPR